MLLLVLLVSLVSAETLCEKARRQWAEVGSAAQRGVLLGNPDATEAENKEARRRFRILHRTVRECDDSKSEASEPKMRRPYNGRRGEIKKRNGEIAWMVRDSRGRFRDFQDRSKAMSMDRRRTNLLLSDRN